MICTVANYEYCFYYYFYQDGTIEHEIRLTGILNVYVLAEGESSAPFGTQIAPRINAQYHQHIFSYRIDPMIDGLANSVVESDIVSFEYPTGSKENFAGNGFVAREKILKTTNEGVRDYDERADRRWSIVNPNRVHYASGKAVGYTLGIKGATIEMMAKEDSWASRRAAFARKTLWVVRDREDGSEMEERLYPSGKYVPQTRSDPEDSVLRWSQEEKSIDGEDILLFVTFGQCIDPSCYILHILMLFFY
jgi:primary-amine oxidase